MTATRKKARPTYRARAYICTYNIKYCILCTRICVPARVH